MATVRIALPQHHAGQQRILREAARFNAAACGRRFGKTVLGIDRLVAPALAGKPVAWGSPTYKMLAGVWREAKRVFAPIAVSINGSEHRIELVTGGVIEFWSLTAADSIRGREYARWIIDEAAIVRDLATAWHEVIRPTLADYRGGAYFLSTPKGRNFFWELFQRGVDPDQRDWAAFQMPTTSNPYIHPAEVEAARLEVPEKVYLQEYLAQFTDGGGLFRTVLERAIAERQEQPEPRHFYVFGLDWGRDNDYTVISVVDTTLNDQVYLDRFSGIDYELQKGRLWALYERFRPGVILAEANNMGGPLIENLRAQGLPIQPFVTTNATKKEVIDGLALALEQGSFHILNDAVQVGELLAFEQTRLPSGLFRYAAAGNGHDDTVIALALSRYAADRPAATDLIAYL